LVKLKYGENIRAKNSRGKGPEKGYGAEALGMIHKIIEIHIDLL